MLLIKTTQVWYDFTYAFSGEFQILEQNQDIWKLNDFVAMFDPGIQKTYVTRKNASFKDQQVK